MHIVMLNDYFGFWNSRLTVDQANDLKKAGHDITFVGGFLREGDLKKELWEGTTLITYGVSELRSFKRLVRTLVYTVKAVEEIAKERPIDLIYSYSSVAMLAAAHFSSQRKIPRIYFMHAPWHLEHEVEYLYDTEGFSRKKLPLKILWGSFLRKKLERAALECSSKILVISEFVKDECAKAHPGTKGKIVRIRPAVDLEKFRPMEDKGSLKRRLGIPEGSFLFATMRRLVPRMGLFNLVRAFEKVHKRLPNAHLAIGGRGPLEARLKNEVAELGLNSQVHFMGYIDEKDTAAFYNACDLFVLPTLALEGFGLVILEALACGTLVLGTPVAAIRDSLGGFSKDLLFSGTDPEDMASKMIVYASEPERIGLLRGRARTYVESLVLNENAGYSLEKEIVE